MKPCETSLIIVSASKKVAATVPQVAGEIMPIHHYPNLHHPHIAGDR